jgi:hypothetical protein
VNKPEALRLADELDADRNWLAVRGMHQQSMAEAATELRRLHQFAEEQIGRATAAEAALQMTKVTHAPKIGALEQQRDALLEALRKIGRYTGDGPTYTTPWQDIVADLGQTARAAIKAVEETK